MASPDYDSPWKDLLDRYFEAFVEFFFAEAYVRIDWTRGFEFLDKELQKITADAAIGRRAVDKLVKVWLKSGEELVVLCHCEVQGDREPEFEKRIYIYHHRISDRFDERVATFILLTDRHRRWRPKEYKYEALGTRLSLKFSVAKILDYRNRWHELERNLNPFAIVVMAHLRLIETARNVRQRLEWKLILTKMLYDRGYSEREVVDLFRFLDWMFFLPEDLQRQYREEIERIEEEKRMPYVTTIERMGVEKGRVEGRVEGLVEANEEIVLYFLQRQFGLLNEKAATAIHNLPLDRITKLSRVMFDFKSPD
ncbi:MAG: cytosolic protein, partial [Acidobacteriota bacterium]